MNGADWPKGEQPEIGLWRAVLKQAFEDLNRGSDDLLSMARQRQAQKWFESGDDLPGDFAWICAQLGLDASAVRHKVLKKSSFRSVVSPLSNAG